MREQRKRERSGRVERGQGKGGRGREEGKVRIKGKKEKWEKRRRGDASVKKRGRKKGMGRKYNNI